MKKKYNPNNIDFSKKGAFVAKKVFKKGQFITELDRVSDIVLNGGQVEMKSQEVIKIEGSDIQVMNVRIYFVSNKFQ